MTKIFISYSHKDTIYFDELKAQLSALREENWIVIKDDRSLCVGDELDPEIKKMILSSNVFIALIGPNYFASDYCYTKELSLADDKKKTIISVIVENCVWDENTRIKKHLVTPTNGKPVKSFADRSDAYTDIVKSIHARLKRDRAALPPKKIPLKPLAGKPSHDATRPTSHVDLAGIIDIKKSKGSIHTIKKSNNEQNTFNIELPKNKTVEVDEQFLFATQGFIDSVLLFDEMMRNNVCDITKIHKENMSKCDGKRNYSAKKTKTEITTLEAFFLVLCKYCANYLLDCYQVRVHVRYYDTRDKIYKKYIAICEDKIYKDDLDQLKYGEGLIKLAADEKRSVLKSVNPEAAKKTKNAEKYKDFLTIVFPNYYAFNTPIFTMGFSVEKQDQKTQDELLVLNYFRIEKIIERHIDEFASLTGINMRSIFTDYYTTRNYKG